MDPFTFLNFFKRNEFRHPELMQPRLLFFLDNVRAKAGVPFYITSDARTEAENKAFKGKGASDTSLHLKGLAVDFVVKPWSREVLYKVVRAIILQAEGLESAIELELVQGPEDRHVHLGLYPVGVPKEQSRLVLAIE